MEGRARREDGRWFNRLWRFVDVDGARSLGFPEWKPGDEPQELLARILEHLASLELRYAGEPSLYGPGGTQLVRTARILQRGTSATCLDVSVLTAAACLLAGLRPWIVGTEHVHGAHAWVVVDLDERWPSLTDPVPADEDLFGFWEEGREQAIAWTSPQDLAALVDDGAHAVIDPTRLCDPYPELAGTSTEPMTTWDELAGSAVRTWVSDVGSWWTPTWVHQEPTTLDGPPRRTPQASQPPAAVEARPALDQRCDAWLASGPLGLVLVGQGGRGTTTALRRLARTAQASGARVLLVAAAPWNAQQWTDLDDQATYTTSDDLLGMRMARRLRQELAHERNRNWPELAPDRWASAELIIHTLGSGRDLLLVFDGLDAVPPTQRSRLADRIETLRSLAALYPSPVRRRIRTVVSTQRDPAVLGEVLPLTGTDFDVVDLDQIDQEPAEIAAKAAFLERRGVAEPAMDLAELTWSDAAVLAGDARVAGSVADRLDHRFRLIRRTPGGDEATAVLLASPEPVGPDVLASATSTSWGDAPATDALGPWLNADASGAVHLVAAARRFLVERTAAHGLTGLGHRLLAGLLIDVDLDAPPRGRYPARHLALHVVGARSAGTTTLDEAAWILLADRRWQQVLADEEGIEEAEQIWSRSVDAIGPDRTPRPVWHLHRELARQRRTWLGLPSLRRTRAPAGLHAAGESTETLSLAAGITIRTEQRGSTLALDIHAPAAWSGLYLLCTLTTDRAVDLILPLTEGAVPRTSVALPGLDRANHDLEICAPLTAAEVCSLDPELLDRSRALPISAEIAARWQLLEGA